MALAWSTFVAIPTLRNYAEAKDWHDKVKPIRGDAHGTRPVGRRDQKWFNIWAKQNAIHVGYGTDPEKRQSIVSYHKDGTILVHKQNRWTSASENERLNRLLNSDVRTHQYDTWIGCAWYDGGVKRKGYLPLRHSGSRSWAGPEETSVFTRDAEGSLVYLNYSYPITHKLNRPAVKEALAPYQDFIDFADTVKRLQGGKYDFSPQVIGEFFGWVEGKTYFNGDPIPRYPDRLRWAPEKEKVRAQFFAQVTSDDEADRMRAVITIAFNSSYSEFRERDGARGFITDLMLRMRAPDLLIAQTHKDGHLVRDRYKSFIYE